MSATGRTLVVTNDFPPRRGGIETWVRQVCDQLGDVVVHTSAEPGAAKYDAAVPFPVVRDPARTLLPTPAAGDRVEATFLTYGCERVLFGAAAPLGLLAPRLRAAGATHVTAMTHGHEVWWGSVPGFRALLRRIAAEADVITYVSEYCGERIGAALLPADRVRMVRWVPPIDHDRFHPGVDGSAVRRDWEIPAEAPVVVCVARLVRRKGQDSLIRAWPVVLKTWPGAHLLLVGDGPERRRLERLARWYGVSDLVHLTGSVPHEDVPRYLAAADVFAMPSRTRRLGLEVEAFGIAYVEAEAMGLAVVRGRSGGAHEAHGRARDGGNKAP